MKQHSNKMLTAELLILGSVALWGSSFALTKPLLDIMGVFTFMALRFLSGGLLLTLFLMTIKKIHIDKKHLIGGGLTGTLLFLAFIFHTYGLKETTVAKNAFIVGSTVIFVPIVLMLFYRQKQTWLTWLTTCLAIIGLGLVTLDGTQGGINTGDVITLAGTFIVTFYILSVEYYAKNSDPITIAAIQVMTVGVLSFIAACVIEAPLSALPALLDSEIAIRNLLILSIGCTSIAYLAANYAQSIISSSRAALLYVFEPIFAAVFAWLILGENMGLQGIIGASLITLATLIPTKKPMGPH